MKKIFSTLLVAVISITAFAQEYPVGIGTITDCGGFLVDNGLSASDYGPNENSTTTICHDGTDEPIVTLYFSSFNLGAGDFLSIYDGNSTSAPLIGTFGAEEAQSLDIFSTNAEGCLTVVFTSDGDNSVGSFGAEISCGLPCERPFPIVSSDQLDSNPIRLCIDEEITFDASASTFANGAELAAWTWDFDDGTTDNSSWPNVTHSFSEPGAYIVQLSLTDNNECNSAFLPDVLIYVATEPDITFTADDQLVCVGQTVEVNANATPVTWSALPDANFGGALYIPDDQSQCFSDELVFGGFDAGATIESESDILNLFINFEHSFMGDLTISFICPNGQSILVHNQGGVGTYLGVPIDIDDPNLPGTGWDYFWSPTATNGTWADNAGGTLPSGTYESTQPFSNLVGCPLNGAWQVEVCDMWGADDGFIFDWSLQFAPDLYPELISFTPSIGAGCDSTFISGNFISFTSADCDQVNVVPTEPGVFTYTFTAYDNHGCTYTENIEIEAYPGPIVDAGDDMPFCGTTVQLDGEVTNPVAGINYTYNWLPGNGVSNSSIPNPNVTTLNQTSDFVFTAFPSDDPQCIVSDTVRLFVPEVPPTQPIDSLDMCAGSLAELIPPLQDMQYDYVWTFTQFENAVYNVVQDGGLWYNASQGGYYQVEVIEPVCGYSSFSDFYVEVYNCSIIIPNVFTPNNDGLNDQLVFPGLEYFPRSYLKVYNRWGGLVYEDETYNNDWSPNEQEASEGTYFFILGLNTNDGMKYYEGHLTLLRD